MQPQDLLKDIRALLNEHAPKGASETKALMSALMTKLNLVSREEFDAQKAVLARTRAKLEALEAQLAQLQGQR